MNVRSLALTVTTGLFLGACAAPEPAPVEERAPPPEEEAAAPAEEEMGAVVRPLEESTLEVEPLPEATTPRESAANPAVVALLNDAEQQSRAGRLEEAAATLERALQIDPDNPWLWHRLARVRLEQERWTEAANLAARSNAQAGGERTLMAGNWELIAEARAAQGDEAGAREARARAADISGSP